jgi:Ca2+-binding RTX toxin-like protein
LAGNVQASRQGNNLVIRGDSAGNEIAIVSTGPNSYLVAGVDTTVNGDPDREFTGISGNIDVDLRAGDDTLVVADDPTGLIDLAGLPATDNPIDVDSLGPTTPTSIGGGLIIRMNSGSDVVGLSVIADFLTAFLGSGNDRLGVLNSEITGNAIIRGEDGNDEVAVVDSAIDGLLLIEGGRGADGVLVQAFDGGRVTLNGGNDSDDMGIFDFALSGALVLIGGGGNDDLEAEFGEASFVHFIGGAGNDELDADALVVDGDMILDGGSGNDQLEVEMTDDFFDEGFFGAEIGGSLIMLGGSGNDEISAGLPDNAEETATVEVRRNVVINAGAGNDSVFLGGILAPQTPQSIGIQQVTDATLEVGGNVTILGCSGNDFIGLVNVFIDGYLLINAGVGHDDGFISFVEVLDHLLALLCGGNDFLDISDVFSPDITLDGGAGNDTLVIDNRSGRRIRGFENINEEGEGGETPGDT